MSFTKKIFFHASFHLNPKGIFDWYTDFWRLWKLCRHPTAQCTIEVTVLEKKSKYHSRFRWVWGYLSYRSRVKFRPILCVLPLFYLKKAYMRLLLFIFFIPKLLRILKKKLDITLVFSVGFSVSWHRGKVEVGHQCGRWGMRRLKSRERMNRLL